jgi:hypothetical protein
MTEEPRGAGVAALAPADDRGRPRRVDRAFPGSRARGWMKRARDRDFATREVC